MAERHNLQASRRLTKGAALAAIAAVAAQLIGASACRAKEAGEVRARKPVETRFYVSKLGNDTDGRTWATAFRTIQKALDAVPPGGGCRIIVRPDVYMESNLAPRHPGAQGAYNELVGDVSGAFGGGRSGWVVIDASDPERGFHSADWWGTIRATKKGWSPQHTAPTFSAIGWDRWKLRNLYATGGDGALMFDCVDRAEPFTVVVENCIGIGRAFGGGVAGCLSRPQEPITFRRCHFWALDWWGDTAAGYVRVEHTSPPASPDVVFEECTLVSPQCALKAGNYGFHTYSRVRVVRCKLIALNFSQPGGTPTDGAIQSVENGKYLHVDLEDTVVLGYRVFGCTVHKDTASQIEYTCKGFVAACVQFQQQVPAGIHSLGAWPEEIFQDLLPSRPGAPPMVPEKIALVARDLAEVSPFIWKGRLCLLECRRPASGGTPADTFLLVRDAQTKQELARFGHGYGLASAFVWKGALHVFASRHDASGWNDVTQFTSRDLHHWTSRCIVRQNAREHLFNTSVCRAPHGFVLAYESDDPAWPAFTIKFARSADLETWQTVPGALLGTDRYAACPCIRYVQGWYYVLYTEHRSPRWFFETWIARSRDLVHWELSSANPVLTPQRIDDGVNTSDPDVVEWRGRTLLYYGVGDQRTWMNIERAEYPVRLGAWMASWFRHGAIPTR